MPKMPDLRKESALPAVDKGTEFPAGQSQHPQSRLLLIVILIVVVGFAVRVTAQRFLDNGAIEADGAGYARVAENLRHGLGYSGIMGPSADLNASPFFTLLISGISFLTGNYEQAGRIVCLVFGALLPLPIYGIAKRIFDRRVAIVAASLTAVHPLLVNLSIAMLTEGPYLTLITSAVYFVVRALKQPSMKAWSLVGAAFGLAYLDRPEAIAPFLIAIVFAVTQPRGTRVTRCERGVAAVVMFVILALPEIAFTYHETGRVVLSAKSSLVFALSARVLEARGDPALAHLNGAQHDQPSPVPNVDSWQPWSEKWAANSIDTDLKGTGIWMRPASEVIRETKIPLRKMIHILRVGTRQNAPAFLEQISSKWFGAPFFPTLAFLGVFCRPWRKTTISSRLFVLLVPFTSVVATFSTLWTYPRFYFVLVPFFIVWVANGLIEIGIWLKQTLGAFGCQAYGRQACQYVLPVLIGIVTLIYPLKAIRGLYEFSQNSSSNKVVKDLGLWLGQQQNHPITIMVPTISLAFYAEGRAVLFPYCTSDLALRFLDAARVDYVVLRRGEKYTHYYEEWLSTGIPDPRAELLDVPYRASGGRFVVYKWRRRDLPESSDAGRRRPLDSVSLMY